MKHIKRRGLLTSTIPLEWGWALELASFPPLRLRSQISLSYAPGLLARRCVGLHSWPCEFQTLIPDAKVYLIRSFTFLSAAKLVMGTRLALAPPVLAHMYCWLREIVTSKEPGHSTVVLPFPIIYSWLHNRFGALFQEAVSNMMKTYLPKVISIVGTVVLSKRGRCLWRQKGVDSPWTIIRIRGAF